MMNKPTQNLSLRTHHPKSEIRNSQSDTPHPQSDIRNPTSDLRHPTSFVHLHVHSHYSMMWGVSSVKTLCKKAAEAGCEYLAITDTNGLYGLIHFLEAARQYGIRPIVGANLQINCHAVAGAKARQSLIPSTQHSALSTQHSALSTQHSALSTQHSALSTQHSHSALSTQHSALSTQHSRGYPGKNPKGL